ncbi:LysR family transcriptional regulator [Actinomadura sp. KC06]|uniref:LysR family transcriptional regulator n=1 Tax=Actinomadura sp. KC06 TaxID=2530369 RepID=UPI0010539F4F|nr:LysR substrate-binding domain-containing protein [Actinomadura sp. KC06]TDD28496.1 LysR family transcriptional regulator [Actinomadura sp. KC06]
MLERHEVEAFLTLAEELHFGRTAERLHVSTARISQTIAKLERRVGVPLFDRTSRRVELTAVGRRLYEDVRPAWDQISAAVEQAISTGRGLSGTLRAAFVGAAAGQLLAGVTELFRKRHSDCDVLLREAQIADAIPWLRAGEIDVALDTFPVEEPGIVMGPVLVSEARMLAVPSGHPFARRESVSVEDLARTKPLRPGPSASTLNEMLTLVGAGHGVFPVGAQTRRYYARPDVTYVVLDDAPPLRWGLLWRADGATARVRAFAQAAHDLLHPGTA